MQLNGIELWSFKRPRRRLVKTGGRLVRQTRYCWMELNEVHLTRIRFAATLRRIALVRPPAT